VTLMRTPVHLRLAAGGEEDCEHPYREPEVDWRAHESHRGEEAREGVTPEE